PGPAGQGGASPASRPGNPSSAPRPRARTRRREPGGPVPLPPPEEGPPGRAPRPRGPGDLSPAGEPERAGAEGGLRPSERSLAATKVRRPRCGGPRGPGVRPGGRVGRAPRGRQPPPQLRVDEERDRPAG